MHTGAALSEHPLATHALGECVGDFAEGRLQRLLIAGDVDVALRFGALQAGTVGAAIEDRQR